MTVKDDIEFLQTLLECAFPADHYAHIALANVTLATTPSIVNHYDWRYTLERMRNSELLSEDAVTQFLQSALPFPCTLTKKTCADFSIEYVLMCKPPMLPQYKSTHCLSYEAIEHIRSQPDHQRFILAKLLTNMQGALLKDGLFC